MRAVQKRTLNLAAKLNSFHSGRLSLLIAVALSLLDLANDRTKLQQKQQYAGKKREINYSQKQKETCLT